MLCLPKSSCVEILTPTGDGIIRRFGLWGCLGHEDGALMVEVSALTWMRSMYTILLKEETAGSTLKAGLHLGQDCGL